MSDRQSRCPAKRAGCSSDLCLTTVGDFAAYLHSRGYAVTTIRHYVAIAERFRCWLSRPRKQKTFVGEAAVTLFARRCKVKYRLRHVHHIQSGLGHLLRMLRDRGELAEAPAPALTAIDVAMREFASHLRETCGLSESTCRLRVYYVQQFLRSKYGSGPLQLKLLCREDFVNFVADFAQQWNPGAARRLASSLRKYLRYLQLQGVCDGRLVAAVPTIRQYQLTHLPRTMTEKQLHTFLASFDRATPFGRRDYAIALLMSTLGLRPSEGALLQLEDLNWRGSSLRIVSPKSRRAKVLPMPAHVGQAIADYLRHGRLLTCHRYVFARHFAPKHVPLNPALIRAMTVRAYRRCRFDPSWNGTHILRHTVATHMHQRGATLKEVADLLGHRSIETSRVYTKVNLPALAAVALPWPEVTT